MLGNSISDVKKRAATYPIMYFYFSLLYKTKDLFCLFYLVWGVVLLWLLLAADVAPQWPHLPAASSLKFNGRNRRGDEPRDVRSRGYTYITLGSTAPGLYIISSAAAAARMVPDEIKHGHFSFLAHRYTIT